jgi:hypothetical protein
MATKGSVSQSTCESVPTADISSKLNSITSILKVTGSPGPQIFEGITVKS